MLWEVDHQQAFPSHGGEGLSGALTGFTKRLERAAKDPRLDWVVWRDISAPLSAGLAPSHHRRWSVRVVPPAEGQPRGWYDAFVARWQAYLEVMARPRGSRPTSAVSAAQLARVRPGISGRGGTEVFTGSLAVEESGEVAGTGRVSPPGKRRRLAPGSDAAGGLVVAGARGQTRPGSPTGLPPSKRRQGTLTGWVRGGGSGMASSSSSGRGAAEAVCGRAEPTAPT